ncbi:MAG: aminotransferase class I/II-fold pyridoxal phosphate-dependent enzyme, partial [Bryobacteraceae bacterium]
MRLPPFELDRWLNRHLNGETPIEFDLGSSTGPHWTLRELLALGAPAGFEDLLNTKVLYSHARGAGRLRRAVARIYGADPDHVQITTGAAEALHILFFLAAEPGANVVLPSPVFPPAAALPEAFGLEIRSYRLQRERGFALDLGEIAKLVDRNTRLLLVNTPHNPTGAVASASDLGALHALAQERGARLVVDTVYDPIYHGGAPGPHIASQPGTIILGDTSKALSLSGLRIGWIVDQDPAAQALYEDTRSYFTVSNSPLNEILAALAVEQREKIYQRARSATRPNLALLDG